MRPTLGATTDSLEPRRRRLTPVTTSTVVFTDGACERNPGGRGGWGWVVDENTFGLGGDASTTNQRMEIRAALEAVRALPRPLTVWSDSRYVVDCFEKSWWRKWIRTAR